MFIFVREGRYVTAANKFWNSILSALIGTIMSFILLKKAGQPVLRVIMACIFIGCVVFNIMFLSTGKRSNSIIACGFGIAATLIPCILQCIKQTGMKSCLMRIGMNTDTGCITRPGKSPKTSWSMRQRNRSY